MLNLNLNVKSLAKCKAKCLENMQIRQLCACFPRPLPKASDHEVPPTPPGTGRHGLSLFRCILSNPATVLLRVVVLEAAVCVSANKPEFSLKFCSVCRTLNAQTNTQHNTTQHNTTQRACMLWVLPGETISSFVCRY